MLRDVGIFLAAAVVVVLLSKRLGLGTVLGYLIAGALIGPCGLNLVRDVHETMHLGEYGVVLLLFLIGLELQPARLWEMRGAVFGAGGAQVGFTTVALAGIGIALHADWRVALVAGIALSMSSTAFALQVLGERKELPRPHGRAAFGILLFQDIAAIPALALVPLLGHNATPLENAWQRVVLVVGVLVITIIFGRYLLRPALRIVAEARDHELSAAATLLVVVGTSLIMHAIGLSMALGAFLAGVLLADTEYRHELEANIEPFKGILLGLFFISVGMSANLRLVVTQPLLVIALVLVLVVVKMLILIGIGRATNLDRRSCLSLAVAISQGGEFAFVIFGIAREADVLTPATSDLLVVIVTVSMALTPLLFIGLDALLRRLAKSDERAFDEIHDEGSRVIIAGFGRFGQIVGRMVRLMRIRFTALDVNATQVDFLRKWGNKIYYGDAARVDLLRAAGAERAEVFVLAIDEMEASLATVKVVQQHFPHLKIVARARNRQHAYALLGLGIENVLRETFAASVEAGELTLEALGISSGAAREAARTFADYDEAQVRKVYHLRDDEEALLQSAKQYAAELRRIFEEDSRNE